MSKKKMLNVYQVILLTWIEYRYTIASQYKTEEKIATALMKELHIEHRILVEESDTDLIGNLKNFKNYESWTMTVSYRLEKLLEFIRRGSFPYPPTMIILKIRKLSKVGEFLKKMTWV